MTDKERIAKLEKEVSELKEKQVHAKDILEIMKLIGEAKKEYVPYPVYPRPYPVYPAWPYQPYTPIWTSAGNTTVTVATSHNPDDRLSWRELKTQEWPNNEVHIYGKREICFG